MFRVGVIDTIDAFERLQHEWDALLDRSRSRVFFLRHHWNRAWWQRYAPANARLHIVTCRDEADRLVGVAPLYWRRRLVAGVVPVRELLFLGMGIDLKTSEFVDMFADAAVEAPACQAIARHLATAESWDRVWMWQVPEESRTVDHLASVFAGDLHVEACDRAPYIDTSEGWDAFKRTLGRSMRRNVEYYPRRLQKSHACELRRASTPEDVDAGVRALIDLHQTSWQARGEPGAFSVPSFDQFLFDVAHDSLHRGQLRLWTLLVDGRIEAALIGFLDGGVLHYFQKGFNPLFTSHELGNVMLALCVRDSCGDPGIHAFDFMGGGAPYKDYWARSSRVTKAVTIRRRTALTALAGGIHSATERVRELLRQTTPLAIRRARASYLRRRATRAAKMSKALVIATLTNAPAIEAVAAILMA